MTCGDFTADARVLKLSGMAVSVAWSLLPLITLVTAHLLQADLHRAAADCGPFPCRSGLEACSPISFRTGVDRVPESKSAALHPHTVQSDLTEFASCTDMSPSAGDCRIGADADLAQC